MAHARADNRYTRGLAEFISGLRYERIPDEVRERLKLLMLDCARLRPVRRRPGVEPHPAAHAGGSRHLARVPASGARRAAVARRMPPW